jgi:hypothetical protein
VLRDREAARDSGLRALWGGGVNNVKEALRITKAVEVMTRTVERYVGVVAGIIYVQSKNASLLNQ